LNWFSWNWGWSAMCSMRDCNIYWTNSNKIQSIDIIMYILKNRPVVAASYFQQISCFRCSEINSHGLIETNQCRGIELTSVWFRCNRRASVNQIGLNLNWTNRAIHPGCSWQGRIENLQHSAKSFHSNRNEFGWFWPVEHRHPPRRAGFDRGLLLRVKGSSSILKRRRRRRRIASSSLPPSLPAPIHPTPSPSSKVGGSTSLIWEGFH